MKYGACPVKNAETLANRGLNPLSAVDGIVTHDNQIANDMVVAFAQSVPLSQQIIDVDTLISDEKTTVEKAFAGANLTITLFVFFSGGARNVGASGAYEEIFQAGSVTKHTRPVSKTVNAVETGAQFSGGRAARNAATDLASNVSKATTITSDTDISHLPPLRQQYIREVLQLEDVKLAMQASGMGEEATARALHQMRREIGIKYKDLTPKDYLENVIYPRNHDKYGDILGPTFDWLREKGKTLQQIIEGALRPDGKDLGLGL